MVIFCLLDISHVFVDEFEQVAACGAAAVVVYREELVALFVCVAIVIGCECW